MKKVKFGKVDTIIRTIEESEKPIVFKEICEKMNVKKLKDKMGIGSLLRDLTELGRIRRHKVMQKRSPALRTKCKHCGHNVMISVYRNSIERSKKVWAYEI